MTPAMFVFFLLVFTAVGVIFLFIHLVMGSFIRPDVPETEKLTIYECGEPTVGSAWVQFDLRYYVVALLFVIFDVEVAFFFPWATVFGKANQLAQYDQQVAALTEERKPLERSRLEAKITDAEKARLDEINKQLADIGKQQAPLLKQLEPSGVSKDRKARMHVAVSETPEPLPAGTATSWARIALIDIAVFFGVLLVGFAYVWRRGDIDWVRAFVPHHEPTVTAEKTLEQRQTVGV